MEMSYGRALWRNFLGQSPDWYKLTLIIVLIVNPLVFHLNPFIAGWMLVVEFIFTLAMALKCYPLLPGGLLAIEAVMIGMTSRNMSVKRLPAIWKCSCADVHGGGDLFYEAAAAVYLYPPAAGDSQ